MAEGDDDGLVPLGPKDPWLSRTPDDPLQQIGSKPILSTSYTRLPSTEHGEGTVWGEAGHNLGLGTRAVAEGTTSLPAMLLDAATYPGRWLQRQLGISTTAPSDLVRKGLDATGLPTAQTPEEQRNAEIIRGGASMIGPMGLGTVAPKVTAALPSIVRPFLASPTPASAPLAGAQVVAGGVGAGTGDALANSEYVPDWLKPTARLAGNVVGAGATNLATGGIGTLANAFTGVKSDIAAALDRLGITPRTMGAVTDRPGIQGAEAALTHGPMSGGILQRGQSEMVDDFGRAVENTAARLDPLTGRVATAQDAGQATQAALRNWRDNIFPAEQSAVWTPLNQRMVGAAVDPSGYRAALQRAAKDPALQSLPETQKAFAQGKVQEWLDALDKDVPPGQSMTWEQAHALKQKIGDQMGTPDIVSSMGNKSLQGIYGGLAGDMVATAQARGQGALFDAANKVTIDGHQFIDGTLSKAIQRNNAGQETIRPDDAAQSLLRDNTGLQQLRDRVPEAADALAAFKLRQMQQAKPSQQGDTSTGSFLTGLRQQQRNDPQGTAALFSDPAVTQKVKDLGAVADQFRSVEKNMNAPRTASTALLLSLPAQLAAAYGTHGLPGAAAVLGANLALPYAGAKYLTNPALIKLMSAQPGQRPPMSGLLGGAISTQATMPPDQNP